MNMMNMIVFMTMTVIVVLVVLTMYKMYNKTEKFTEDVKKVYFIYANWCGHCTRFKPEWKKFAEASAQNNVKTFALDVDDSSNTAFIEMNKVTSFPTVIVAKGSGEKAKYEGERTAEALNAFVKAF